MFADLVRRPFFASFALVSAALIAGCADTRGGTLPYHAMAAPDEQHFATLPEDYKIAPMDTLTIKVFKADDLSGDYAVDLAGHISLPLVGQVEAANLTTAQLDTRLTQLLGQKYFEHPDVSVAIKESTAHVVTVDGAVNQSGQFAVGGPMTLIQAIALAHGTTEDANARRVAIFRTIDGRRAGAAFDLTSIRRGEMTDPQVYPGDVIVVDGSKIKETEKRVMALAPLLYTFQWLPL